MSSAAAARREAGGTCLNRGCIPTKTLLHASAIYRDAKNGAHCGIHTEDIHADMAEIFAYKRAVSQKLSAGIESLFKTAKIDLLRGTQLGRNIRNYTFFSYEVREALHLSEQERRTILDCLHNIRHELQHAIDRHSRTLVVNNIEMFLNYCVRFYDRQFITRSDVAGKDILARFERTLDDYFLSDKPQTEGLPTVQYCAQELHLSANYFGDLVKRLTGKTAQEHIRLRLIDAAKERIADPARSIAEVAYELGFKYPAHFTRLFKNVVGCTPNRYRNIN